MVAGAAVIVAGAIALAIMTRGEPAPLKRESHAARESSPVTVSASTSAPARDSSATPPTIQAREVAAADDVDVAEPGNGSSGELLQRLADQYAQHHWPEAVAACLNPDVAIAGADQCAISACELHDTVHARRFFSRVSTADRAQVRAACEAVHVPVDRPLHPWLGAHRRPFRAPIVSPAGSGG